MATLNIWNHLSLVDDDGIEITARHGAEGPPQTPHAITVTGHHEQKQGTLATASVRTLYSSSADFPTTFAYLHYVADQITYLQLVAADLAGVVHRVAANQPIVLPGYSTFLAGAAQAAITGGAEPTLSAVTTILIGNYSGSTAAYRFTYVL